MLRRLPDPAESQPSSPASVSCGLSTSGSRVEKVPESTPSGRPPFLAEPPALPTYRERDHRRLDARTYQARCATCIWGCRMPVEMIIDHWNPSKKKYRFKTFCYGPKSCALHRAGPKRKGISYTEENRVDDDATAHRSPDD